MARPDEIEEQKFPQEEEGTQIIMDSDTLEGVQTPAEPGTDAELPLQEELPVEEPPQSAAPVVLADYQRRRNDIYTLMLIISFIAFLIISFVAGDEAHKHYDWKMFGILKTEEPEQPQSGQ